jgi:hypothetical protein
MYELRLEKKNKEDFIKKKKLNDITNFVFEKEYILDLNEFQN